MKRLCNCQVHVANSELGSGCEILVSFEYPLLLLGDYFVVTCKETVRADGTDSDVSVREIFPAVWFSTNLRSCEASGDP